MSAETSSAGATEPPKIAKNAVLSADRVYRYRLTRLWDDSKPWLGFLMVNPSTADAEKDDPTIRRCMGFARTFNCGGIWVANLYAFRGDKPEVLKKARDPVGPGNADELSAMFQACPKIIAAYGACHPLGIERVRRVEAILMQHRSRVFTLGYTLHGFPRHPLFVAGAAELCPFEPLPEGAVV